MLEVENFVTLVLVNVPFFQDEDHQNRFRAVTFWWKIEQIIQDCCDMFMFFSIGEFFHILLLNLVFILWHIDLFTWNCYSALFQGLCRTVQGPALIDLQAQTQLLASDFQVVFLLCTISFPLGNFLGKYLPIQALVKLS